MKSGLIFIAQLGLLWILNALGYWLVGALHLPLPGNVAGMLILFFLLVTGVVQLKWIQQAASFLIKHLAFFFIPIAVGLMDFGPLFAAHGLVLILALVASGLAGIFITGHTAQLLRKKKGEPNSERSLNHF
ncbi:CidA/LrgA family protein [Brevibacillus sp. SYSU BS000544]|uniref:CidA/LrgA family protein n=1 Tax=Brevibacillus sp. SYSU BS000544 TaxID=3416443 RepID=UPI003CE4A524